jgi:tetratricopeptide (TPR) repeat protein
MAPTRPKGKKPKKRTLEPGALLDDATRLLQQGEHESAVLVASKVLEVARDREEYKLPALNLLGLIHIEAGDPQTARKHLVRAVEIDENGTVDESMGGGAEKFLWLAQLSDEGGRDSVDWYEKGAAILKRQIRTLSDKLKRSDADNATLEEKRRGLSGVLCAVAEVYMTDLSWEEDAEQRCEALITEATLICPEAAETWQTVANVRISQQRVPEAREALKRSLDLWRDLPPDDLSIPDFPTRVSLSRLLLEVEMEKEAMEVLERLITDDDESVEAWYLGGWCQFIVGQKGQKAEETEWLNAWTTSRRWLSQCLELYETQEYEDERLGEHAKELLEAIQEKLGHSSDGENEADDWEDAEVEETDEEMNE